MPLSARRVADPRDTRAWACFAAFLAVLSAAVSLYWTTGGTALLDSLGGALETLARRRDATSLVLGIGVIAVKLVGAVLALLLLGRSARRQPRVVVTTAKVVGVGLVLYGSLYCVGAILGLTGIAGEEDVDRTALWGHALLWDPWFVIWGVALWMAATPWKLSLRTIHANGSPATSAEPQHARIDERH